MNSLRRTSVFVLGACVVALTLAPAASAAATRTWVSGVGDDVNPCSRTAPCKTFAGAISKTDANGEIDALDPGGFGAVTITKGITIDGGGFLASVLNVSTNGVIINAPDDDIVLRNMSFHGGNAATPCTFGGVNGVRILAARTVRIEHSSIGSNAQAAVSVEPTAGAVTVFLDDVDIRNNCEQGVDVQPSGTGSARVYVRNSTIQNSGAALLVGTGGEAWISGSTLFGNAFGYQITGTGAINAYWGTQVIGNTDNGVPTRLLDVPPAGAAGADGAPGPAGPVRVVVASPSSLIAGKVGRKVVVPYLSTSSGATTITIRRGTKVVGTIRSTAKLGRNAVVWSGRLGAKRAVAGLYKLTITTRSADGQSGSANVYVRLVAPRR